MEDKAYRLMRAKWLQIVTAPQYAEFVRLLRGQPGRSGSGPPRSITSPLCLPPTGYPGESSHPWGVGRRPLNRLIELELVQVTGRAELPGRPLQYGTTDAFLNSGSGTRRVACLRCAQQSPNRRLDAQEQEPAEEISDEDVGLAKEPNPDELPLDQKFAEIDWQTENAESNAAAESSEAEPHP